MAAANPLLPSPLLALPIELVHQIAERHCSKEMLQNLSLASCMMANVCRPLLFQRLDLHKSPQHPTMNEPVTLFTGSAYPTAVILASTLRFFWFRIPETLEEQILVAKILSATTHCLHFLYLTGQNIKWDSEVGSYFNAAMLAVLKEANLCTLWLDSIYNLPTSMLHAMMGGTESIILKKVGLAVDDIEDNRAVVDSHSPRRVSIVFHPREEAVWRTWQNQPEVLLRFRTVYKFVWEAIHLEPETAVWILKWAAPTIRDIVFVIPTTDVDILCPRFPTLLPHVWEFKLSLLVLPNNGNVAWRRVFNRTLSTLWSQMNSSRFPLLETVEFQLFFRNANGGFPLPATDPAEEEFITSALRWLDGEWNQIASLKCVKLILTLEGWDLEYCQTRATEITTYFLERLPNLDGRGILLVRIYSQAWFQEYYAPENE
ncbi:hypothetical protein R3P38DRAFT_3369313 [Favolaschia claudopus]|uniref:F-box domain-containing protein n=1 Tax=Favolaschia claudopus TaxID=2862362 RepID=A0AAW0A3P7_9AGAR